MTLLMQLNLGFAWGSATEATFPGQLCACLYAAPLIDALLDGSPILDAQLAASPLIEPQIDGGCC